MHGSPKPVERVATPAGRLLGEALVAAQEKTGLSLVEILDQSHVLEEWPEDETSDGALVDMVYAFTKKAKAKV